MWGQHPAAGAVSGRMDSGLLPLSSFRMWVGLCQARVYPVGASHQQEVQQQRHLFLPCNPSYPGQHPAVVSPVACCMFLLPSLRRPALEACWPARLDAVCQIYHAHFHPFPCPSCAAAVSAPAAGGSSYQRMDEGGAGRTQPKTRPSRQQLHPSQPQPQPGLPADGAEAGGSMHIGGGSMRSSTSRSASSRGGSVWRAQLGGCRGWW